MANLPPQGLMYFPGIESFISGSFTLTHGVSPSSAVIYIAPQRGRFVPKVGDLTLEFGSFRRVFHNCVLDYWQPMFDNDGREIWALHFLDERWRWTFRGAMNGYYNVRTGTPISSPGVTSEWILPGTQASARDLAKLCLKEMGIGKSDVQALPEDALPEIEWRYVVPAHALAALCEAFGCHVVLKTTGKVTVEKVGVGKQLPVNDLVIHPEVSVNSPEIPERICLATAPKRYQLDLDLEAVGEDTDGEIKPIDELSYTPTFEYTYETGEGENVQTKSRTRKGWQTIDPMCGNVEEDKEWSQARDLARKTVFRWYRIKVPTYKLPEIHFDIESIEQLLPLEIEQLRPMYSMDQIARKPAWVFGWFVSDAQTLDTATRAQALSLSGVKTEDEMPTLYTGSFSIDRARGIVQFGTRVFLPYGLDKVTGTFPQLQKKPKGPEGAKAGWLLPAQLRLRTTVSVRNLYDRAWACAEYSRKLKGGAPGSGTRYLVKDDVNLDFLMDDKTDFMVLSKGRRISWKSTEKVTRKQVDYYLDAAEREYQTTDATTLSYAGFVPIEPDGAIQQVTWSVDNDGRAMTTACRNREEVVVGQSYREKRQAEQLREVLRGASFTNRAILERLNKGIPT